ncbi:BCD family MFS transporter [Methylobacterium oxalidis]|uniref:MFS transporter n=1 Tax=Methylobacterium oxalidis TaxID=944322 RepID=A0A512IWF3_9HYPH|nr:BCD family MFS transporter [Methylobacterium oxalidis]GEP02032.1 MFS transporter [Methylobacterium oxalidis]GJE31407.1 Protein PucC [Methylobacterium oxalidis]GLS61977.1 MFS transporter [Methylobacterium oxalidis]
MTGARITRALMRLTPAILPFADAATAELPLGRLMRLALFQVTVGMAAVLLIGTLNRVMIVELAVPAWIVALMLSLPLIFAPLRALVGFRSDRHRSVLGWRRVPFIWFGTLLQFGGLAIMPFALLLLSGDTTGPVWAGQLAAALAFVLVGAGLHTVQTVGLALATDLAPARARPKVVALLCVMLLVGMMVSALAFGLLLADFSAVRLIQVIQGAALVTIILNGVALWKQEPRDPERTRRDAARPNFSQSWALYAGNGLARRRLVATGLGTAAFSMQDILLEPYGGQILHLSVAATTALTAMLAAGGGLGLLIAARWLNRGGDPFRVAAAGAVVGIMAFSAVVFAAPLASPQLFATGVTLIGLGGGLFAHGTLTASMAKAGPEDTGLALGAWGAVQASAAGLAIAASGIVRDVGSELATSGALGEALSDASIGYLIVYHIEIALLFATLVAIGPLVREGRRTSPKSERGLAPSALVQPSS